MQTTNDKLIHGIAADGTVRCMAAVTTALVAEAKQRHATSPTVTAALGRLLTGTLLMAASLKELDRLTVQISCDGAVGGMTAEANATGGVRGYVRNPQADPPLNAANKFDVSSVVGKGMFNVMREAGFDIGFYPEPYRGSVPLISGEIAEDFAFYLNKSEQIPSAVLLGVHLRGDAATQETFVTAAGGIMLQMMPGATDETVSMIEENVRHAPHLTTLIRAGAQPEDLLTEALRGIGFEKLDDKLVRFECTCSPERATRLLASLAAQEIGEMIVEDNGAVMNCPFCNATYQLSADDLREILDEKRADRRL